MIGKANAKWRDSIDNHDRLSMSLATKARERERERERENDMEYEGEREGKNGMVPSYSGALQTFSYWNVAFQHSRQINGESSINL